MITCVSSLAEVNCRVQRPIIPEGRSFEVRILMKFNMVLKTRFRLYMTIDAVAVQLESFSVSMHRRRCQQRRAQPRNVDSGWAVTRASHYPTCDEAEDRDSGTSDAWVAYPHCSVPEVSWHHDAFTYTTTVKRLLYSVFY